LKFFLDNNLSERLAHGMKAFGEDVVHLKELFPQATEDVSWLKYVGDGGLFLVTRDERLRWNPAEIRAIREHRVGAFFLGGKERSRLLVGLRCGGNRDVQAPQCVDLVVLDLGEDDLFLNAQVEIAAAVE